MATPLAHPWVCVFLSRTGGRAQARFVTKERARRFAERHAHSFASSDTTLRWVDTVTSSVLSTDIGEYLVTRIEREERRIQSPTAALPDGFTTRTRYRPSALASATGCWLPRSAVREGPAADTASPGTDAQQSSPSGSYGNARR